MSKHIELAKKIKALQEKGIDGEKINAEIMLNKIMHKHGLTTNDLEQDKINDYYFTYKPGDHKLWVQIVKRVNHKINMYGPFPDKEVKAFSLSGNYMISCTAVEYVEIETMLSVYEPLYKEELDIFFSAFCRANDLLVTKGDIKSIKDLSDKELEDYIRAQELSAKIKSKTFRKQISDK